jgi:hypothetical protein
VVLVGRGGRIRAEHGAHRDDRDALRAASAITVASRPGPAPRFRSPSFERNWSERAFTRRQRRTVYTCSRVSGPSGSDGSGRRATI